MYEVVYCHFQKWIMVPINYKPMNNGTYQRIKSGKYPKLSSFFKLKCRKTCKLFQTSRFRVLRITWLTFKAWNWNLNRKMDKCKRLKRTKVIFKEKRVKSHVPAHSHIMKYLLAAFVKKLKVRAEDFLNYDHILMTKQKCVEITIKPFHPHPHSH